MTDKQHQKRKQKARRAQAKAQINRDKARRKLLRQRKKLARRRTQNRHQSEKRRDDERGTNLTARSTLPPQKSNAENANRNSHSTVPETPKYSAVPARERLYGQRLHRKMSERRDETSATTRVSDHDAADEKVSTDE